MKHPPGLNIKQMALQYGDELKNYVIHISLEVLNVFAALLKNLQNNYNNIKMIIPKYRAQNV